MQMWTKKELGEICKLRNGRAYKKQELLSSGKYPVLRVGNFFTSNHWYHSDLELDDTKYCDKGDLLYAWSASFGPRIWSGEKSIFHYHIWRVDHDEMEIAKKFLFYWFEWDAERIKKDQGAGTTMVHVSMKSMNARSISFPSLSEQERIAAILDGAFAAIATAAGNAEKNFANAGELFESRLNRIFRSPRAAVDIRDSGDGESPDWPSTPIGDLFETVTGSTPPKSKKELYGDFIPFIKPPELTNGTVRHSADGLSESGAEQARVLPPESVLVSCIGILGKLGMNEAPVAFNQQINAVKPNYEAAYPRYVFYYCLSDLFRDCLHQLASGTTVSIVNKGKFDSIRIPIAPLPKQKRIVASLDELSASTRSLARIYEKKLSRITELKQSILHKAFTGELTADTNTADRTLSEAGL